MRWELRSGSRRRTAVGGIAKYVAQDRGSCNAPILDFVGRPDFAIQFPTSSASWAPASPSPWAASRGGIRTFRLCIYPNNKCFCWASVKHKKD